MQKQNVIIYKGKEIENWIEISFDPENYDKIVNEYSDWEIVYISPGVIRIRRYR